MRWRARRARADHLICPRCRGVDIGVLRNMLATRDCRTCGLSWLPADDPPDAGGPYVASDERFWPRCGNCGKVETGKTERWESGVGTISSTHEDGTTCTYPASR